MTDIDWDELRQVATDAMTKAYAPYSRYRVGAAALVGDGRIVAGCNVENASYGVTPVSYTHLTLPTILLV